MNNVRFIPMGSISWPVVLRACFFAAGDVDKKPRKHNLPIVSLLHNREPNNVSLCVCVYLPILVLHYVVSIDKNHWRSIKAKVAMLSPKNKLANPLHPNGLKSSPILASTMGVKYA